MGRVSRQVPSLHAVIKVAPTGIGIHERAFTAAAGSPDGDRAVIDGAKAMAMTVIDVWTDESLLPSAREHFEAACLADPLPDDIVPA
jgi:hypothetical protein